MLLFLAGVTVLALLGLLRLQTDVGYAAFLGESHPAVRRFDAFLERFGGGYPIAVVWSCAETERCERVFDDDALRMAAAVAGRLRSRPGIRRVESPATSLLMLPSEDGIVARRFVDERGPVDDVDVLAERALGDRLWVGSLVSADGQVGAILIELRASDSATSVAAYAELEAALAPFRDRGYRYHLVGGPIDFVVAGDELRRANERLVPLVGILLAGVIWLLVRSVFAVAATLASGGLAVLWTLGLLGWIGWPQNTLTQTLPPLVLVISACHGLHLLWRGGAELGSAEFPGGAELGSAEFPGGAELGSAEPPRAVDRAERAAALLRVARDIGGPCVITTLTTAGAFLSFATSGLESFVRFGIVSAAGAGIALLLSFAFLPILLQRVMLAPLDRGPEGEGGAWERAVRGLTRIAHAAPLAVVCGAALVGAICAVGLPRLEVDVSYEDLYGEDSRVVRWVRFVEENLRAPETLEIEIGLPDGERLSAPERMDRLAGFEAFLSATDGLGRVHSILDPLRAMNRLLHDGDPEYERTGRTARENAGLLFLLGGAAPLDPWVTVDLRYARLSVEASKVPQDRLRELIREVRGYVESELPASWTVTLTGPAVLVHTMVEEVKRTQLYSFVTAGLVVLVLVALFLRSFGWAVLAMIPTGLPVLLTLGVMGFAGVRLDIGTAMVAAVVIGIAIDDTVHLLTQYRRRRARGLEAAISIEQAVAHVARALITTSVALALGFLSLVVSPWSSVASFGVVASLAISVALLADLVVLPALILVLSRRRAGRGRVAARI